MNPFVLMIRVSLVQGQLSCGGHLHLSKDVNVMLVALCRAGLMDGVEPIDIECRPRVP